MNKVIMTGHIGKDPETKSFSNGTVSNFSLATTRSKKVDDKWEEETDWHNVVYWGKRKLQKGDHVGIEGFLRTRSYDVKGVKRYTTEVITNTIEVYRKKTADSMVSESNAADLSDQSVLPF